MVYRRTLIGICALLGALLSIIGGGLSPVAALITTTPSPAPKIALCTVYPSATPSKGITPTATLEAPPIDTATPMIPSATPTAPAESTAIPTGKTPGDLLMQVRYSPIYQRKGVACVQVYEATPGGPASLAGIVAGDLILKIDKVDVVDLAGFLGAIAARKAGDTVNVTIQRNGSALVVAATLGLSPYADPNATTTPTVTPTKKK